jgi:hypothetical protein
MYYAVDADTSSLYSLNYYFNNGTISVDSLESSCVTDFLEVNKSDSFYLKLTNFQDDTLRMSVYKGYVVQKDNVQKDNVQKIENYLKKGVNINKIVANDEEKTVISPIKVSLKYDNYSAFNKLLEL